MHCIIGLTILWKWLAMLNQNSWNTWISNVICRGLFCVQRVNARRECSLWWYCWNCSPSLLRLSPYYILWVYYNFFFAFSFKCFLIILCFQLKSINHHNVCTYQCFWKFKCNTPYYWCCPYRYKYNSHHRQTLKRQLLCFFLLERLVYCLFDFPSM